MYGITLKPIKLWLCFVLSPMTTRSRPAPPPSLHPPSFHPSSVKLSAKAVVMATGKGSGGEPLSCIQRFSGRKVIRELLFSMLSQYEKKRWGEGETRMCGRQRQRGWQGDERTERTGKERDKGGSRKWGSAKRVEVHRGRKQNTQRKGGNRVIKAHRHAEMGEESRQGSLLRRHHIG